MAKRPIFWALGILATASYYAVTTPAQLASLVGRDEPPPARAAPAASQRKGPAVLTVAADYRGHFMVHPSIDNFKVQMLVDTGASFVSLTDDDARALGIKPQPGDYTVAMSLADGSVVRAASVRLKEVRLGDIVVRDVKAVVMPKGMRGVSLLGSSFLNKLQGYEFSAGRLVLRG